MTGGERRGKVIGKKEKCSTWKQMCKACITGGTESVRYDTENVTPYFRTVLFLKIPYVILFRTFCQNLTVPHRSNPLPRVHKVGWFWLRSIGVDKQYGVLVFSIASFSYYFLISCNKTYQKHT